MKKIPWFMLTSRGVACLFVFWGLGQLLRDVTWYSAWLFYIPTPFVCVCACALAALYARSRRWKGTLVCLLMVILSGWVVACVENHLFRGHDGRSGEYRLVQWNLRGGNIDEAGWRDRLALLNDQEADLYVLAETPRLSWGLRPESIMRAGYVSRMGRNMAVVARGRLSRRKWLANGDGLFVFSTTWTWQERQLEVFVVDLASTLRIPRAARLDQVMRLIREHQPDLVVGDFNAPRRSLALSALPEGYVHAYDEAGEGLSYSWPTPLPVYAIDQCIVGPRLEARHYELVSSLQSDHRIATLAFDAVE